MRIAFARGLVALLVLVGLVGCLGGQSAGEAVEERLQQLSRSEYDKAWETLHPTHQAIVPKEKFIECGLASEQVQSPVVDQIQIQETRDERRQIAELGVMEVKVVRALLRKGDLSVAQEYEMLKVDGEWRWVLNQAALDNFRAGECP